MVAVAAAKESGAAFLSLRLSPLQPSKMRAAFRLAEKLAPCVLLVDEMDALFRTHSSGDHVESSLIKGEFLQLWDRLSALSDSAGVVMLGASTRPDLLDEAVLRRMPCRVGFELLKREEERWQLLHGLLANVPLAGDVSLAWIAERTEGYSGGEMKELCRRAVLHAACKRLPSLSEQRSRDATDEVSSASQQRAHEPDGGEDGVVVDSVSEQDFMFALTIAAPMTLSPAEERVFRAASRPEFHAIRHDRG